MLKDKTAQGTRLVIGLIVVAIALAAAVIAGIRYGGPLHREAQLQDELLADILPPPAFVVEPYLHATWAIEQPTYRGHALEEILEEQKVFKERKAYWDKAPVPDEMRADVTATIHSADAFWTAIDTRFLPALRADNEQAMREVHARELAPAYQRQHDAVERLVKISHHYRVRLTDRTISLVTIALSVFTMMALAVIGMIVMAGRTIRDTVIAPLTETAETMNRMATGDYNCEVVGNDRQDEIGVMARAIEVFRSNGIARQEAEAQQRAVVSALSAGLESMAHKDLEYRIDHEFPAGYEALRRNYNTAVDALSAALRTVHAGSTSVLNSIVEIRAASDDLAYRNEQQAARLGETSSAMNEVTESVQDTASSALSAQETIAAAHRQANDGGEVVSRAVAAMAAIEASAQEISQIISVIDGIAFQTNLLALNAGVEAARAGDAGKGFAVVATEVRALAQRSADAAQNIKTLIRTSSAQVEEGVMLVGETGNRLIEIVEQVAGIDSLVRQIAESASRQAAMLHKVNAATGEMDRMTQANVAMVEESSAATRVLSQEAERLTALVATFRTRADVAAGQGGAATDISNLNLAA